MEAESDRKRVRQDGSLDADLKRLRGNVERRADRSAGFSRPAWPHLTAARRVLFRFMQ